jgi:hypothetical protein
VDALEGLDNGSGSAAANGGQQQQHEQKSEYSSGQRVYAKGRMCAYGLGWVNRGQGGMNARAAMC